MIGGPCDLCEGPVDGRADGILVAATRWQDFPGAPAFALDLVDETRARTARICTACTKALAATAAQLHQSRRTAA